MRTELRLALRESRGSFRHSLFLASCIAVGVGALAGVSSFGGAVERAILKEARALLAGDVRVGSRRPLSEKARRAIPASLPEAERTEVLELAAMASVPDAAQLVELKAVGEGYPFYGRVETRPEGAWAEFQKGGRLLAEESLLARLDARVGDRVRLGDTRFLVAGTVAKEPDRSVGDFSFGPRAMVLARDLPATGLVQAFSRVRYATLLKLPPGADAEAAAARLEAALGKEGSVRPYTQAQPWLRRFLGELSRYLSLLGLTALLLAGVAAAMSVQAFLREKLPTIAILRCLGFPPGLLVRAYLLQTAGLALAGGLAGLALGLGLQSFLPRLLSGLVPEGVAVSMSGAEAAGALGIGVSVALLFAAWPILATREARPLRILRRDVEALPAGRRPWAWAALLAAGLAAVVCWQAGKPRDAAAYLGASAGLLVVIAGAARGALALLRRLPLPSRPELKHGVANLLRPGAGTTAAVAAVGLGVAVTLSAVALERSLLHRIQENLPGTAPDFFFIDIQSDQRPAFAARLARAGLSPKLEPVARARLVSVKGVPVEAMDLEGRRDAWYFEREYVLTFSTAAPRGNAVVRGALPAEGGGWVSVEQEAAKHLGLDLGDAVELDVLGSPMKARVGSIRKVNWSDFSTNFYMVFSPDLMAGVQHAWLASARVPKEQAAGLQRDLAREFPNVTAIHIRELIETVSRVLGRLAAAVRFMGALTAFAGAFVLVGAVASTRFRRLRESALLKTLGATRFQVRAAFLVEYGLVGAAAAALGAGAATVLAWVLAERVMKLDLVIPWGAFATGMALAAGGTALTGVLATWTAVAKRPLEILRSE